MRRVSRSEIVWLVRVGSPCVLLIEGGYRGDYATGQVLVQQWLRGEASKPSIIQHGRPCSTVRGRSCPSGLGPSAGPRTPGLSASRARRITDPARTIYVRAGHPVCAAGGWTTGRHRARPNTTVRPTRTAPGPQVGDRSRHNVSRCVCPGPATAMPLRGGSGIGVSLRSVGEGYFTTMLTICPRGMMILTICLPSR